MEQKKERDGFGLWEKTSKDGNPYYSTRLSQKNIEELVSKIQGVDTEKEDVYISLFQNTFKTEERHPTFNVKITRRQRNKGL